MQSVPITTNIVSLNPALARCSWIHHYEMKFVSNLRQVGSFPPVTPVSSTNKTDCHDIAEILFKVVLNTINKPKNVVIVETICLKSVVNFTCRNTYLAKI